MSFEKVLCTITKVLIVMSFGLAFLLIANTAELTVLIWGAPAFVVGWIVGGIALISTIILLIAKMDLRKECPHGWIKRW